MRRIILSIGIVFFCALAHAQSYPSKPVKLVVPFPAGSATDQVARVIGQELQGALGQPFVVDNKPGAQGTIAAEGVAKSAPDGYTLMVSTNTPQAAAPALFKQLRYDPVKDFQPIARLGTISFMLMVAPEFPAKNLKEFLAHAKANPGKLTAGYGSAGSQVSQAMLQLDGQDRLRRRTLQGHAASDHRCDGRGGQLYLRRPWQRARAAKGRKADAARRDVGEALVACT
jgi:tripartite-type tricarboxylate transporter receptor subunit TctC